MVCSVGQRSVVLRTRPRETAGGRSRRGNIEIAITRLRTARDFRPQNDRIMGETAAQMLSKRTPEGHFLHYKG